jgi:hypothetical protein
MLENLEMKYSILLAILVTVVLLSTGCQEKHGTDSSRRSSTQAKEDFEQELKEKIAMTEQHLAIYRTNGYVTFKIEPSDASFVKIWEIATRALATRSISRGRAY